MSAVVISKIFGTEKRRGFLLWDNLPYLRMFTCVYVFEEFPNHRENDIPGVFCCLVFSSCL